jgi:hypothetical protein
MFSLPFRQLDCPGNLGERFGFTTFEKKNMDFGSFAFSNAIIRHMSDYFAHFKLVVRVSVRSWVLFF